MSARKNQQIFKTKANRPLVIAGPCMAESPELLEAVLIPLKKLADELGFDYVFKASFDKANRTSITSYRGPGLRQACDWFMELKKRHHVPVLTDVHEVAQVAEAAAAVDVLQVPAFLSRQTDLLAACVASGRAVNVKKGQFMAPDNARHITQKVMSVCHRDGLTPDFALTERGVSFGYGNLIVDMRAFPMMRAAAHVPLIFDVTHSLQLPSAGGEGGEVSGGLRQYAPALARAAVATGYVDGLFIEVHAEPGRAKSDAATQLSITQAEALLRQLIPLWHEARSSQEIDVLF